MFTNIIEVKIIVDLFSKCNKSLYYEKQYSVILILLVVIFVSLKCDKHKNSFKIDFNFQTTRSFKGTRYVTP